MRQYIKIKNFTIRGIPGSSISMDISKGEVVAITGASGTGKTTLVSCIAGIVRPEKLGMVLVDGLDPFSQLDERKIHRLSGIVQQDPDDDIVFESILRDIAFAPENIGLEKQRISKRAVSYFKRLGLMGKQKRKYSELSLSEKQSACLAGVLIMHHDILVMDDAFSMMEEENALKLLKSIISAARKKNQTVIFTSNKYDELELADRIIQLKAGTAEIKKLDEVDCIAPKLDSPKQGSVPGAKFGIDVTVPDKISAEDEMSEGNILAGIRDLHFSYGNEEIISGMSGGFERGCLYRISGPAASGKSTFLKLLSGVLKPDSGEISIFGKLVCSGQLPSEQLFDDSVIEDVMYQQRVSGVPKAKAREDAEEILSKLGVPKSKWDKDPLKLSMGEQRLVVLAGVFVADADIIMLDRPFAGLDSDGYYKVRLYIDELLQNRKCVIVVE
jgi:ABC-type cobalt transport system, ATPase component